MTSAIDFKGSLRKSTLGISLYIYIYIFSCAYWTIANNMVPTKLNSLINETLFTQDNCLSEETP